MHFDRRAFLAAGAAAAAAACNRKAAESQAAVPRCFGRRETRDSGSLSGTRCGPSAIPAASSLTSIRPSRSAG